jgi:hypothetical protein
LNNLKAGIIMKQLIYFLSIFIFCATHILYSDNINVDIALSGPSSGYIGQTLTFNVTVIEGNVDANDILWYHDYNVVGSGYSYSFSPNSIGYNSLHNITAEVPFKDSDTIYCQVDLPSAYIWSSASEVLVGDEVDFECRPSEQNVSFEQIEPPVSGDTIEDPTTDWVCVEGHDYWARTKECNDVGQHIESIQHECIQNTTPATVNVYSREITFTKSPDVNYIVDGSGDSVTITATGYLLDDLEWELYKDGSLYSSPSGSSDSQTITADSSMSPGKYVYKAKRQNDSEWQEADFVYITDFDVYIQTYSPTAALPIGDDLSVNYVVTGPSGFSFDSLELQVYNYDNDLVYKRTDLVKTVGSHSTSWIAAKWNQGGNSGSYANPNNGPYTIKVLGTEGTCVCGQYNFDINTKIIIEANITDKVNTDPSKVDSTAIPSGLGDLSAALDVNVSKGTVAKLFNNYDDNNNNDITITDITDGKHIEVDNSELNNLEDGQWNIQIKDVRDEIGNFFDADKNTGAIVHKSWNITIN